MWIFDVDFHDVFFFLIICILLIFLVRKFFSLFLLFTFKFENKYFFTLYHCLLTYYL